MDSLIKKLIYGTLVLSGLICAERLYTSYKQRKVLPKEMVIADINGDGLNDLVHSNDLGVYCQLQKADGEFTQSALILELKGIERIAAADIDNNKTIDLVLITSSGEIIMWKNSGKLTIINRNKLNKD